jgi:hypothetical protein
MLKQVKVCSINIMGIVFINHLLLTFITSFFSKFFNFSLEANFFVSCQVFHIVLLELCGVFVFYVKYHVIIKNKI